MGSSQELASAQTTVRGWRHATRGEVWGWLMNGSVRLSQHHVGSVPEVGYQIVKVK